MLQANIDRARELNLQVGLGFRDDICAKVLNNSSSLFEVLVNITAISDYIYCNIYPSTNAEYSTIQAANDVIRQYNNVKSAFQAINSNIEVHIGETGWPSEGIYFNGMTSSVDNQNQYWRLIDEWPKREDVHVQMFQANDTFNGPNVGDCHFGLLAKDGDKYTF